MHLSQAMASTETGDIDVMKHESGRMVRPIAVVIGLLLAVSAASIATADQAYHTERLPLEASGLEDHPELTAGHVVNIHPNGPINYAHERYMVNGAAANTDYAVVIEVHGDAECGGIVGELPTGATLTTNRHGNGHARVTFTPEDVADFRDATFNLRWSLRVGGNDGPEAYGTRCTEVVLD
jgi:hypothetical protein